MAELNVCIFCGKEPEKPRVYGYQLTPRRNTCYCIDHSCDNGTLVSVHGYSGEEVVEKWNKIMPAADVAPVRHGQWIRPHWKNSNYCCDCSECGGEAMHRDYQWYKNSIYPICPNCGAKMDGDE